MARWFLDIFGRLDPASSAGLEPASRQPSRSSASPEANEKTVRIERPKSEKLSWPARDGEGARPSSARNPSRQAPDAPMPGELYDSPDPHAEQTRLVGSRSDRSPLPSRRPQEERLQENSSPPVAETRDDDMTRIVMPSQSAGLDPVVGWLVVIAGPGRGRSLEIGAGSNGIGRAPGQKLCLNFGDINISREKHALLTYDPRSRRFFLNNGEVRNLTYVDDNVVLTPIELKGGETIAVGDTRLRFVRFCDSIFSWS